MHTTTYSASTLFALLLLLPLTPASVLQKRFTPLTMGRASTFGAIANTGLSNSGNTVVTGNCGTCPGTSITGFPPGKCTAIHSDDTAACNAEADCATAYNNALAAGPTTALTSSNLGGQTLSPGVYTFPTSGVSFSGTLKLNGAGNPNGQYIFQIITTLTTSALATIVLQNGAQACNVYFAIGSSATIAANNILDGNFLAYTSISVGTNTTNTGTLCAIHGAITLIDDALKVPTSCTTG